MKILFNLEFKLFLMENFKKIDFLNHLKVFLKNIEEILFCLLNIMKIL